MGLPARWRNYFNMSYQIPGTRFVAFKVPLKHSLLKGAMLYETEEFFDVNCVVKQYPNMGLVIDLTNTDRYYDPTEFKKNNVLYYKLKTVGHYVPANHIALKFMEISEDFFRKNYNNDKLIGVHCTHGVNRTGYFILRYMIQKLDIPPEEAISTFNYARGHAVERENYLADLKSIWSYSYNVLPQKMSLSIYSHDEQKFGIEPMDINCCKSEKMAYVTNKESSAKKCHVEDNNGNINDEYALNKKDFAKVKQICKRDNVNLKDKNNQSWQDLKNISLIDADVSGFQSSKKKSSKKRKMTHTE